MVHTTNRRQRPGGIAVCLRTDCFCFVLKENRSTKRSSLAYRFSPSQQVPSVRHLLLADRSSSLSDLALCCTGKWVPLVAQVLWHVVHRFPPLLSWVYALHLENQTGNFSTFCLSDWPLLDVFSRTLYRVAAVDYRCPQHRLINQLIDWINESILIFPSPMQSNQNVSCPVLAYFPWIELIFGKPVDFLEPLKVALMAHFPSDLQ